MKKHWTTLVLVVILLAGLSLLLYPSFSDYWNSFHQSRAIATYAEAVNEMDDHQSEKMLAAARAYNEKISRYGNLTELSLEDQEEYNSLLDVTGTGIMGYLEIPRIDVFLPIYHGTDEAVLQIAVGHLEGTSFPVGGLSTHAVLSGHRGLPSAKLLTNLDELVEGDTFTVQILNETLTYMVDQIRIVLPEEVNDLAITDGQDYLTLVTCTPYGINTHRLLVRGRRTETIETNKTIVVADAVQVRITYVAVAMGAPVLILWLLLVLFKKPKKSAK